MKQRKWLWLSVIVILLAVGYYRIGYKQVDPAQIPASADAILSIDVKRVTNTLVLEYLTSPSWWHFSSDTSTNNKLDWDDVVEIPDYLFLFHPAQTPVTAWFTCLQMEDSTAFEQGMKDLGFTALQQNHSFKIFQSSTQHLDVVAYQDRFLIGTALNDVQQTIQQLAQELFEKKQFCKAEILKKITGQGNHAQLYLAAQSWLPNETLFDINFNKTAIYAKSNVDWPKSSPLPTTALPFHPTAFFTFSASDNQWWLNQVSDSIKKKWSTALNFSIDATLQQPQTQHWIELTDIRTRKDSAISIEFDDNFNEVKKVVVNQVQEPEWFWKITGAGQVKVRDYFVQNHLLQQNDSGWLFVPMPFVRSFQQSKDSSSIFISSNAEKPINVAYRSNALLLVYLNFNAISPGLQKWLPEVITQQLNHLHSAELIISKPNNQILVELKIRKQDLNVPLFR